MSKEDIIKMLPLKINITESHRIKAINEGGIHKLGGILLKETFPNEDIFWGLSIGTISTDNGTIFLKTDCTINYNGKKEIIPLYIDNNFNGTEITFKLRQP